MKKFMIFKKLVVQFVSNEVMSKELYNLTNIFAA